MKCKKSFLIFENIQKYLKCPALRRRIIFKNPPRKSVLKTSWVGPNSLFKTSKERARSDLRRPENQASGLEGIVLAGGWEEHVRFHGNSFNMSYLFDLRTRTWTRIGDMNSKRVHASRLVFMRVNIGAECRLLAQCWRAGHFRYFFIFSIIKKYFFAFFIRLITYFCTSPI